MEATIFKLTKIIHNLVAQTAVRVNCPDCLNDSLQTAGTNLNDIAFSAFFMFTFYAPSHWWNEFGNGKSINLR